jgi:hypothetical protein
LIQSIDAHSGYETATLRQIFKKLVNKNAIKLIKAKIGDTLSIFLESLDPSPRQKSELPPPLNF